MRRMGKVVTIAAASLCSGLAVGCTDASGRPLPQDLCEIVETAAEDLDLRPVYDSADDQTIECFWESRAERAAFELRVTVERTSTNEEDARQDFMEQCTDRARGILAGSIEDYGDYCALESGRSVELFDVGGGLLMEFSFGFPQRTSESTYSRLREIGWEVGDQVLG